ncbi:MAG: single-stranded-DNA-specific exonuclease RecJ [Clostridiales bacterium]|nr:single-stranded-DNA-specific exonuclease RecJ [Clostridiales bacterium]
MIKENWILKNSPADYRHICGKYNISYPLARILANKGITKDEDIEKYLNRSMDDLPDYNLLKDLKKAVSVICKAVDNGKKIRIVGDYDVDGVSSTFLLVKCLTEIGAFVSYKIPDRVTEGYGINMSIIEDAIKDGIDLIITCDNGIAAAEQIKYAIDNGLEVIVTDHHEIPETLPEADCIINPKQKDCDFPEKEICGALVAAFLCEAVFKSYGFGSFISRYTDVLALATVCDVMDLTGCNRSIVYNGIRKLNTEPVIGLKKLIEVNNLCGREISAYHLGFVLGPCINATGRLESANLSVELLLSANEENAKKNAEKLYELNALRKEKTERNVQKAIDIIDAGKLSDNNVLVVYIPYCHESLAGIIAGRLKEKYHKPTICFTDSGHDEDILKGSARSVEEYNMFEKLSEIKDLFLKFGGHKMAAGLSILRKNLEEISNQLNSRCKTLEKAERKLYIDNAIAPSAIQYDFINELKILEPLGKGNEKPVFADRNLKILNIKRIGKEGNYLRLSLIDSEGKNITAVMFNHVNEFINSLVWGFGEEAVENAFRGRGELIAHFTYYPEPDNYNGAKGVNINITGFNFPQEILERIDKNRSDEKHNHEYTKPVKSKCIIVGAGEVSELINSYIIDSYIIACDKGYEYCHKFGIKPDIIIGDFDSLEKPENIDIKISEYPVEKDDTDTALALKHAISSGYDQIYMFGALGGSRIDHSLANISLVSFAAKKNISLTIIDDKSTIKAIFNNEIRFLPDQTGNISVFAYGGIAKGVTIKGLKYEVENINLMPDISLGVSNSFTGRDAFISVENGTLLIVYDSKK